MLVTPPQDFPLGTKEDDLPGDPGHLFLTPVFTGASPDILKDPQLPFDHSPDLFEVCVLIQVQIDQMTEGEVHVQIAVIFGAPRKMIRLVI